MTEPVALIAEGDTLTPASVTDSLLRSGLYVAGPLQTVRECMEWIDANDSPAMAVVALDLRDGSSEAVIARLRSAGTMVMVWCTTDQLAEKGMDSRFPMASQSDRLAG